MSEKKRMGFNPLTGEGIEKKKDTKKPRKDDKIKQGNNDIVEKRKEMVRKAMRDGTIKNIYENRDGEIMQRVLIHLPYDLVEKLRLEAFESIPRRSLSRMIKDKLEGKA